MSRPLNRDWFLAVGLIVAACGGGVGAPSASDPGSTGSATTPASQTTEAASPAESSPEPATVEPSPSVPLPPGTVAVTISNDAGYDQPRHSTGRHAHDVQADQQ